MSRMSRLHRIVLALFLVPLAVAPAGVRAQGTSLGSFRWQLQPFCNVMTLAVTQQGAEYGVDGSDDLCGAARRASVVGRAFPNPDGSIGFGLTAVTAPGATPIHVDATIDLATIGGTWRDSAGNVGGFVFTPGAGTGGSPRPIPSGGVAPGIITAAQLAAGAVTAAQLAPGAITTAALTGAMVGLGSCPAGRYLRGYQGSGAAICEPYITDPISTIVDSPDVGSWQSVAVLRSGLPIVSHFGASGALRVTHCSNPGCTSATSRDVDVQTNQVGGYTAIATGADGMPIAAHQDLDAKTLRIAHCGDEACSGPAFVATIDAPGFGVGFSNSIAIGADGLAVVAHRDASNRLRVTHCSNLACSSSTSRTVDGAMPGVGYEPSIAIGADGLPIISHVDQSSGGALRMTHCGDVACNTATSATLASMPARYIFGTSMAIGRDGLPVVAFVRSPTDALAVAHCRNVACTEATDTTPVTGTSLSPSIAIGSDGFPIVVHHGLFSNPLRVTHCSNAACTAANTVALGPGAGVVTIGADGLPVIAVFDDSGIIKLRMIKCRTRSCA